MEKLLETNIILVSILLVFYAIHLISTIAAFFINKKAKADRDELELQCLKIEKRISELEKRGIIKGNKSDEKENDIMPGFFLPLSDAPSKVRDGIKINEFPVVE